MMCQNCVRHVSQALNAIEGISATVDLENNCAYIEGEAADEELIKAIEEEGYECKGFE